jgi:hypothetical protein
MIFMSTQKDTKKTKKHFKGITFEKTVQFL